MNLNNECWVLLYSPRQKAFNYESYGQMTKKNMAIFANDLPADYITLDIFETLDQLHKALDGLREIQDKKVFL